MIQNTIVQLNDTIIPDGKEVTAGFDGFVDSIVRVIRSVDNKNSYTYFQEIAEFGEYLIDKENKSCSVELDEQVVKIGGNMPIFGNALGKLGVKVNCIGAMGYPEVHQVFRGISENCTVYSVANPGYCTALEFRDGKVMLANNKGVNSITWSRIKDVIGMEKLFSLFANASIIGMLNWGEIKSFTSIWEGIIRDILSAHKPDKRQMMFFDLSDCSKRSNSDIQYALKLLENFNDHYSVTLSLNENETGYVFNALGIGDCCRDPECMGEMIYSRLNIDTLIVHPVNSSTAWNKNGKYRIDNLYIERPALSTGGGDNFNAGYCMAQLIGMDIASSLIIANAASGFYVKNGFSANKSELIDFLHYWQQTI